MAINGITFDRMRVTTKSDALLYYSMLDNNDRIVKGYKNELNVSATGLSVFVSTGACVVQGRLIDIDEEELVSVSANDTGYICLVIDLTQVNTSEGEAGTPGYTPVNNQVRLEVVKTLVQQDLFEDGKLYTFPLASFTSTGTTVNLSKIDHNKNLSRLETELFYGSFKNLNATITLPQSPSQYKCLVFDYEYLGNRGTTTVDVRKIGSNVGFSSTNLPNAVGSLAVNVGEIEMSFSGADNRMVTITRNRGIYINADGKMNADEVATIVIEKISGITL